MTRKRVLFVCTHNSARSQMAEAMVNAWAPDTFEAFSAGTEATAIRPETIAVMAEIGLDLAGHRSKSIEEFQGQPFDWFVTVCDDAAEELPGPSRGRACRSLEHRGPESRDNGHGRGTAGGVPRRPGRATGPNRAPFLAAARRD